ncbi:unnamed protein product, partial [marine sediment metagenome]
VIHTDQATNNDSVWQEFVFSNITAYRYYKINITSHWRSGDDVCGFYEVEMIEDGPFTCYSEDTIKEQGSYSLKGVAVQTDSLNNTLTRTVSPTIDLSDCSEIRFDVRASRTGSQFKIGIHDSGGTTTEHTVDIDSANVWQTETWDISGVTNVNKDVIDQIIITIINADASNVIYIDHLVVKDHLDKLWNDNGTIKIMS